MRYLLGDLQNPNNSTCLRKWESRRECTMTPRNSAESLAPERGLMHAISLAFSGIPGGVLPTRMHTSNTPTLDASRPRMYPRFRGALHHGLACAVSPGEGFVRSVPTQLRSVSVRSLGFCECAVSVRCTELLLCSGRSLHHGLGSLLAVLGSRA